MDFAQARYFAYNHGRFTSPDPLAKSADQGMPQTWNRYAYVFNNPFRFTDPTGMIAADFYDREGNWLGTDEVGDKKIYILGPNQKPNTQKPNVNWGGKLDQGTVDELKGASELVGGLIILNRTTDGKDSTIGEFKTVGGNGSDVQGYMLEPAGPSTNASNQDKRVPEGLYDVADYSSKKFPDNFIVSNGNVSASRLVLFHAGNNGKDTEACILPGATKGNESVGGSKKKMDELRKFIHSKGASNVKFIIRP